MTSINASSTRVSGQTEAAGAPTRLVGAGSLSPRWAIVRHYKVLYSSDGEHKAESNRVWQDGRVAQHTFNGKLFLYSSPLDLELATCFAPTQSLGHGLLSEGTELQLPGEVMYAVEVVGFERVTRTDISPLVQAREEARQQNRRSLAASGPQQQQQEEGITSIRAAPASATASTRAGSGSAPTGPKSSHAFRTPFKRKLPDSDADGDEEGRGREDGSPSSKGSKPQKNGSSSSSSSSSKKKLGSTRARHEEEVVAARE